MVARSGSVAAFARAYGIHSDNGPDDFDISVASHWAGAGQVHFVAIRPGHDGGRLNAAFVLPDMISYFLVGGAASIAFVTILTRYRDTGPGRRREEVAVGHPDARCTWFSGLRWFWPRYLRRCISTGGSAASTRKRPRSACVSRAFCLPAQFFFFAGGVFGAVLLVRKQFNVQAVSPLIYNLGTIVGGILLVKRIGVSSLADRDHGGCVLGPFLLNWIYARRAGIRYRPILDWQDEGLRGLGAALIAVDGRRIAGDGRQLDHRPLRLENRRRRLAVDLRQAVVHRTHGGTGASGGRSLDAFFRPALGAGEAIRICHAGGRFGVPRSCLGLLAASAWCRWVCPWLTWCLSGGRFSAADARECAAYFADVLPFDVSVVGPGYLLARLLCGRKHLDPDAGRHSGDAGFASHVRAVVSLVRGDGSGGRI